jgi:hypothetical protein
MKSRTLIGLLVALLMSIAAGYWLWPQPASLTPPSMLGLTLGFIVTILAVAVLFDVRQRGPLLIKLLAGMMILVGPAGAIGFSWQAVEWRRAMEQAESNNLRAIAQAMGAFVFRTGHLPSTLEEMVTAEVLTARETRTPLSKAPRSYDNKPDYYVATMGEPWAPQISLPSNDIIVAYTNGPRMSKDVWLFAYADGTVKFIREDDIETEFAKSNHARIAAGWQPYQWKGPWTLVLPTPTTQPASRP